MYPIVVNIEYCTTHNSRLNEGNKNCSVQIRFNFRADHGHLLDNGIICLKSLLFAQNKMFFLHWYIADYIS